MPKAKEHGPTVVFAPWYSTVALPYCQWTGLGGALEGNRPPKDRMPFGRIRFPSAQHECRKGYAHSGMSKKWHHKGPLPIAQKKSVEKVTHALSYVRQRGKAQSVTECHSETVDSLPDISDRIAFPLQIGQQICGIGRVI